MKATLPLATFLCLASIPAHAQDGVSAVARSSIPRALVARESYLMGTLLSATVEAGDRQDGLTAIEGAFSSVRRLEDVLSTWRPDTELSRLNAFPAGKPFHASPELLGLLLEARIWSRRTGGTFDPGIGSLVDVWDLRGDGRVPSGERLREALESSGVELLEIDESAGTVARGPTGWWLDSGGFGKGAALRNAGSALRDAGVASALLDFGGQVLAVGDAPGGRPWSVPVADPGRRDTPVARLRLRDASASTSGASERFVEVDGRRYGHIVDPRDGRPVPAWGSVTVVARDPLAADALSTALFVMGPDEALRWADEEAPRWADEEALHWEDEEALPWADQEALRSAEGADGVGVLVLERTENGVAASWNAALDAAGIELAEGVERRRTPVSAIDAGL